MAVLVLINFVKQQDAELRVYEMGIANQPKILLKKPAMTEQDCVNAICYGMAKTAEPGIDLLCLGEMIANTSGSAMAYALFGGNAIDWTGSGSGVVGDAFQKKVRVVSEGVKKHRETHPATIDGKVDGLKVLQHLGGFELCAIVGAIIAGRSG